MLWSKIAIVPLIAYYYLVKANHKINNFFRYNIELLFSDFIFFDKSNDHTVNRSSLVFSRLMYF
jgi:hypothetical protein